MLIPVHPGDGATPPTWAMIELQGEIERNGERNESEGFDVGTLTTSSTVTFIFDSFTAWLLHLHLFVFFLKQRIEACSSIVFRVQSTLQ